MRAGWLLGWCVFIFFFIEASAEAVKVNSLYKGIVPVTTQAAAERSVAVQHALTQVLIKVSGNDQILSNPQLKSRLSTADTLVQQVGYVTPSSSNNAAPYLLEVQFDAAAVNQWLQDAGTAIWGQNRPLMVAWITEEIPGHPPEMISSDSVNDIAASLKLNAEQRGLPILLPMMDMTDLNQASTKDVAEMAIPNLINAAKRYASDAVLIGHVTQTTHGFASQWKLVLGDNQWDWSLAGKTITDILPVLINNIMNTLAARFAVVTTNTIQKDLIMKVTGITHYSDFAQLTRYLTHLTPVAAVEITKTTNSDVILKVSLRSTQESFTQALSLGKKLTPAPITNPADTMVVYQWNP